MSNSTINHSRWFVYGYRLSEQDLPVIGPIKDDVVIKTNVTPTPNLRPPVKVSLGCHIQGTSLPHVDPTDVDTVIAGVKKRFACKPPDAEEAFLSRFKTFVSLWCIQHLVPLSPNIDLSVGSWLETTGYPRWRVDELKRKWADCGGILQDKHFIVKSFVKDESYPEFKHARWINARTDEFKCAVGPTFKAIEKSLFESSWFVKKIPVKDRADYIYKRVYRTGARYVCTDYTAFESHFTKKLFDSCEFVMYKYMTQYLPNKSLFVNYLDNVIAGTNKCVSKLVNVTIPATRMSGEMCTSLGNGFSNLMFMLFICHEKGCTDVVGVVEGDDGLFTMTGDFPTTEDFKRLGLTIKLIVVDDLTRASFCGLIFDLNDRINIADPIKIIAQTGFTTQEYMMSKPKVLRGLLKAKAFSLAYQYPGCPIISSFSRYLLRVLADDYVYFPKGKSDLFATTLQKEAFTFWNAHADVLSIEPGENTRILMEQQFKISIADQLAIERYFDNLDDIVVLNDPILLTHVPLIWRTFADLYMMQVSLDPLIMRTWYD